MFGMKWKSSAPGIDKELGESTTISPDFMLSKAGEVTWRRGKVMGCSKN